MNHMMLFWNYLILWDGEVEGGSPATEKWKRNLQIVKENSIVRIPCAVEDTPRLFHCEAANVSDVVANLCCCSFPHIV